MGKVKKGSVECRVCGTPSEGEDYLSCTGQCPTCGEWGLVWNLKGLTDSQSVPYKIWRMQWEMSHYGRPKNTTPPPGWIANVATAEIRHANVLLPDRSPVDSGTLSDTAPN